MPTIGDDITINNQNYHNHHEMMTDRAYSTPGMLPHRYVYVLTSKCNLSCSFCFQEDRIKKSTMTELDWLHLTDQLPEGSRVTLTGGDPFVFSGFKNVFRRVAEKFTCNVITNGILLNPGVIDYMLAFPNFKVLAISIDDIGNKVRDVKKRQWDNVESMMRYFAQKRTEIGSPAILEAKTVVLDENANDLFDIHRYCIETLKCDNVTFQFLKGSPIQHANYAFNFSSIYEDTKAPIYKNFAVIEESLEKIRKYNVANGKFAFLHPIVASVISDQEVPSLGILNEEFHDPTKSNPVSFLGPVFILIPTAMFSHVWPSQWGTSKMRRLETLYTVKPSPHLEILLRNVVPYLHVIAAAGCGQKRHSCGRRIYSGAMCNRVLAL